MERLGSGSLHIVRLSIKCGILCVRYMLPADICLITELCFAQIRLHTISFRD